MKKRLIFLAAALLWTAFIWHNSLQPAEVSGEASGSIVELVQPVLDAVGIPEEQHSFVVRKSAHMTEFAVLALLWSGCFGQTVRGVIMAAVLCVGTAGADEIIQRFVPGRSCEIRDFCIDTLGAGLGIAAAALVRLCLKKQKKTNE